ncbi:VOC family protein [Cryobacterium algoricola]|uniref:VOC family protein n=1 Tax=Cryobacterium algoricola TaxID=1259183 RepID=UPI002104C4DE|nr:VOC family protein [Cryobacterium algoricola]
MIGHIDEVVIDCRDPEALATFWASVLGGEPRGRDAPGGTSCLLAGRNCRSRRYPRLRR